MESIRERASWRRDADALAAAGLTGAQVFARPVRETTAPLAEQAAAGALAIDVHIVLPLERAAEGLVVIAAGKARGKIVITIGD
ncbi:zinc-binding dehydrogenase [Streptomyces sp. NPDC002623]